MTKKEIKCQKHGYRGSASFCPDCEIENLLKQDDKFQRELKENKYIKANLRRNNVNR